MDEGGEGMRGIAVFAGSAHPGLAREISECLGVPLSPSRVQRFANDCLEVQLQDNCRERDVFLIQPLSAPVQEHLVELLLMINAARGASASRVTVVMPFYAYARSDKKEAPRISLGGRLVADLLVTAGADRILTTTLHSPQVHGFFSVPVDHLNALAELAGHFKRLDLANSVVVSPDLGNAKEAADFARRLGVGFAMGAKRRFEGDLVEISAIVGEVEGKDVIVLDDEIAKGSTVLELLVHLRRRGARQIRIACTHGLFADGALDRLCGQDDVLEVVCSNTVPVQSAHPSGKLTVLSVAPVLAEAIRRIHAGESVGALCRI
jgi:ribose-phosphate pyrophosphokinase